MSDKTSPQPAATPRIAPLSPDRYSQAFIDFASKIDSPERPTGLSKLNIVRTLAHHPDLAIPYLKFGTHVLQASSLPARIREIATLRAAWLFNSDYEWNLHAREARRTGMTVEEVEATKTGSESDVWSEFERSVVRAVDQLRTETAIDDETWNVLAGDLDTRQLLDFLFTVGSYAMLAMVLNGIRIDMES